MKTVTLYRPVGLKELELIMQSGWKKFPPRLEWQPIFYPVLNQPYAAQIASQWNTRDEFSGYCGIVLEFLVDAEFCSKYEVQNVGGAIHNELWVPAEELEEFNSHLVGSIRMVDAYFGDGYQQPVNEILSQRLEKLKK